MNTETQTPAAATTEQPAVVQPDAAQTAVPAAEESAVHKMLARYENREKIVVLGDDEEGMKTFADFIGTFDDTDPLTDWTTGAPGETFTTLAVVKADDASNRMIAIADKATALADAVVGDWLYKRYVAHVVKIASQPDASAAQFVTVAGCFREKFSTEAFKELAGAVVHQLRERGLFGITRPSLQMALRNAAFASSQFPRLKPEHWKGLLGVMIAKAEQTGKDTSLFKHWLATRDLRKDEGGEIELDLDALSKEMDEAEADNASEAAKS